MKLFRNRRFILANLFCIFIIGCAGNKVNGNIEWVETYGTKVGTWIYFYANGKRISKPVGSAYNDCDSCRYMLKYDKNDPKHIDVDYTRPLFLGWEKVITLPATITRIRKKNFLSGLNTVSFRFSIGGRNFDSYQALPDDFETKYNLKAGDRYVVDIWPDNTTRCVLHLDRPLAAGTVLPDELLQLKVKKGTGY